MLHIPHKHSLVTETSKALRVGIEEGVWQEYLPGERILSKQLCVSRPTLRLACDLLEIEGLITGNLRKRRKIVTRPKLAKLPSKKVLGIIAGQRMDRLSNITSHIIMDLRYHLSQDGFDSEVYVCPHSSFGKHQKKLESFIREHSIFCCILMLSSKEQQAWFRENGIPAFVLGSPNVSVGLPSLDIDYRAASRHAAGILLGRGHRHLAIMLLECNVAGDQASEIGFVEGVKESVHEDARYSIIRHNGNSNDICRKLDRFLGKSDAPTALLVCNPLDVLISFTHMLHQGVSIPEQISLISRDYDYCFERLRPSVAHYDFPLAIFSQRLTRLMFQLVEYGYLPSKNILLMPHFMAGETVGYGPAR